MPLTTGWVDNEGQQVNAAFLNSLDTTVNAAAIALTATAVKTSLYNASANQLIPADATSGSFTIHLPTAPADSTRITIKKIDSSANTVTYACGGSDVLNKTLGSTSAALTLQNQAVVLQYAASPAIWYITSTDAPLSALVLASAATSTATAGDVIKWDANVNLSANNVFEGFQTIATAAGTTSLTITSPEILILTGSTTQTVKLPTTSVPQGATYTIVNQSTGAVTVQSSGSNTVVILAGSSSAPYSSGIFTAAVATPTTAANWNCQHIGVSIASGKLLTVSNSLTLAGTDATTMTFPSSSDTVVGLAATQTLTNKTLTGPTISDNSNIVLGSTNGTKIATATSQKLGFYNTTPVVQPSGDMATALSNLGLVSAPSAFGINNGAHAAQSQVTVAGTNYYITNSGLTMPASPFVGMTANSTRMQWRVCMTKTAAGTGAFNIVIYRGTNGSTSDTADVTQSIGTQTAAVDDLHLDVQVVVTTTGSSGAYYWSICPKQSAATATGFGVATGTAAAFSGTVSSVALNTASLIFGLGFASVTGTPTIVIPFVDARCFNMS